ncbi:hypothetical protein [Bradyrhizobium sp. RT9a]|uniref:hypothetical protein n=1 Tax=Bradyrhizobium sp. RT9a TaxID=3156384 RepID=UPI003391E1A7
MGFGYRGVERDPLEILIGLRSGLAVRSFAPSTTVNHVGDGPVAADCWNGVVATDGTTLIPPSDDQAADAVPLCSVQKQRIQEI